MNPHSLTTEQYQELYKEVLLFAEIGGVTQDENVIWKMCEEEYINELIPATEAEDTLGVIDSVADSFVTLAQLHHYYLSKPSWEQPIYDDIGWVKTPFFSLEAMLLNRKENLVPSCMADWLDVAKTCAKEYNFNLYKAIKEVNRSNMTKYPSLEEVNNYAVSTGFDPMNMTRFVGESTRSLMLHYVCGQCVTNSNGKYKGVVAHTKHLYGKDVVVFRADFGKGKIVKWPGFQEPNFDHCWL
jgi:hypothetical protein